ncbi:MAG: lytic transglycosylase domain-containing protein [Minisyncoccota bacterium]
MNKNNNQIDNHRHLMKPIFIGALILVISQIPAAPSLPSIENSMLPIKTAHVMAGQVETSVALVDEFFGSVPTNESQPIVDDQIAFVSSRKAYPASLEVIEKHEKTIKSIAREKGVPEDVAIGVSLLENGGSETARSSAGAVGVFQLMPGTARSLGLTVNSRADERLNTSKNIEAGITYLAMNYDRFGDWGLATWAYHAGEGNVAKALKLYAMSNHGIALPGVGRSDVLKNYVTKYDVTIHKLLSDSAVKTLTRKLNDDSAGYPYKVIATATLFKLR